MAIFDWIAIPLGYVLYFIYSLVNNYFLAIFLFTLLVRAAMFPLSLKSQKSQAERAKLAPRIERLQKKYAKDPKKLQEKQMALYEKHGVSMTGGCLPMVVQMVLLFGIISAIYKPLTHLMQMPEEVISTSISAVTLKEGEEDPHKFKDSELQGYYGELNMLSVLDQNEDEIRQSIDRLAKEKPDAMEGKTTDEYIEMMETTKEDFTILGISVLENPGKDGWTPNWLWIIAIVSGLTAMASSLISMHYTKQTQGAGQPGQGCTNVMLIAFMPLFSLFITFQVPGGVGIYWICSNLIACIQTVILNKIYNPVKIREQAELEYQERRRQKAEDKKRLAEARKREQSELQKAINEQNASGGKKSKGGKAKPAAQAEKPEEVPADQPAEPADAADTATDEDTNADG